MVPGDHKPKQKDPKPNPKPNPDPDPRRPYDESNRGGSGKG
jgi:hypothetical protein